MSPLYLGGIGALVMLAVAGLVMRRRAAAEADDEGDWQEQVEVAQATESSDDTAAVFAALTEEPAAAMDQHAELEQEPEAEVDGLDEAVTAVAEQADSKAEPTDPLAEAEVYCSYDRHDEAIAMLQKALEQDPGRTEIQLKIMAIYADLDRESDFMKAYDSLAADGNDDSLQLAQQLVAAKGWLDDTSVADPVAEAPDLTVETPSATDAGEIGDEIADVELDFDLDFDLSDVESLDNTEQNTVLDLALDNLNLDDDDAGLEFDLNLDDETPEAEAADSEQGADATVLADMLDADGDLDDDLSEMVDGDEIATKLDLARAYVDMGDVDGARDILDEVLQEGSEVQVEEANSLLRNIAS